MNENMSVVICRNTGGIGEEVNRCCASMFDSEERARLEVEIHRAKEIAEAAIRAKDRSLAIVSHELRAPLAPVICAVQTLMDDPNMSEESMMLLRIIEGNIATEMHLIEDLLEMTRLSNGMFSLKFEPVDAHDVVHKAIAVCMPVIDRKGIALSIALEASSATVDGDPVRLQQVVWNLLRNAATFTPEGGEIRVVSSNDESGHLLIEVVDNGIGIDEQTLPFIFNAFDQGDDAISKNSGGLGLGLTISKMLIEMLGGRISASSEGRGRGATFRVELNTVAEESVRVRSGWTGTGAVH